MSSSRPRSGLSCDVTSSCSSSSNNVPPASPSLPSKVYDCRGAVVHLQDMLRAGVVEIQGGDGRSAYCFFQVNSQYNACLTIYCLFCLQSKDAVSVTKLCLGSQVRCNAWLLDEAAKIPYLVSNLWPEEVSQEQQWSAQAYDMCVADKCGGQSTWQNYGHA